LTVVFDWYQQGVGDGPPYGPLARCDPSGAFRAWWFAEGEMLRTVDYQDVFAFDDTGNFCRTDIH
jgi:hypothetical protein